MSSLVPVATTATSALVAQAFDDNRFESVWKRVPTEHGHRSLSGPVTQDAVKALSGSAQALGYYQNGESWIKLQGVPYIGRHKPGARGLSVIIPNGNPSHQQYDLIIAFQSFELQCLVRLVIIITQHIISCYLRDGTLNVTNRADEPACRAVLGAIMQDHHDVDSITELAGIKTLLSMTKGPYQHRSWLVSHLRSLHDLMF